MEIEDVHKNTKLLIGGIPYNVVDAEFMKPGKGRAIYRLKLRNLLDGSMVDRTYHSSEKVEEANVTSQEYQFLYKESDHYVFMSTDNFEQHAISEERLGDKKRFLKEGTIVTTSMMGDTLLDVALPNFVELQVVERALTTKTATVTPQSKAAVLETSYTLEVPAFIKEGDIIKVDTRSGTYVERVGTRK